MNEKQLLLECSNYFLEEEFIITHTLCSFDFKDSLLDENLFILTNKSVIYTTYKNQSILLDRINYSDIIKIDTTLSLIGGSLIIRTKFDNYIFRNINKQLLTYLEERLNEFNSYVLNYGDLLFDETINNLDYINNNATLREIRINNTNQNINNNTIPNKTNIKLNQHSKKSKAPQAVIGVVIFFMFISAIAGKSDNTQPKQEETTSQSQVVTENNSKENNKISQEEALNTVLSKIEKDFEGNGIVKGELTEEDGSKIYVISVEPTIDLIETIYIDVNNNNGENWKNLVTNIKNSSAYCKVYLNDSGYSDIDVGIFILNNRNKENVLLTLFNGEVLYDVANTL